MDESPTYGDSYGTFEVDSNVQGRTTQVRFVSKKVSDSYKNCKSIGGRGIGALLHGTNPEGTSSSVSVSYIIQT